MEKRAGRRFERLDIRPPTEANRFSRARRVADVALAHSPAPRAPGRAGLAIAKRGPAHPAHTCRNTHTHTHTHTYTHTHANKRNAPIRRFRFSGCASPFRFAAYCCCRCCCCCCCCCCCRCCCCRRGCCWRPQRRP